MSTKSTGGSGPPASTEPEAPRRGWVAYRLLVWFLDLVTRVFFRRVEVVGLEHVPDEGDGPVIFAGNHPNSLIDPVLIVTRSRRIVHFAAKDTLFTNAIMRRLLRTMGAVPIARKADHGEGARMEAANEAAFSALFQVLVEGRAVGIFPEGLSHDAAHLAKLKTGAARIALGVTQQHAELKLRIVPCGLTFIHPKRFRSRVLLQFGPPIEIDAARRKAFADDAQAAARALTSDIETALRALTVNAEDWTTLRVLDGVRRLYQPAQISMEDRVELARRFNEVYPRVKNDPSVAALFTRVSAYLDRLRAVGLTDRDLRRPIPAGEGIARVARHLLLLVVWLPLALPGAILHAPIGLFASWAGRRLTPRKDVMATTKMIIGLAAMLLGYVAFVVAAAWGYGAWAAIAVAVGLPLSGYATLQVLDRTTSLRRATKTLVRLAHLAEEAEALRRERAELEGEVVRAVERHKPPEMVALFPRAST